MPPGPAYGQQPGYGTPYPGMPGQPGAKKRSPVLPIVLVLALVAAGVGGYFLLSGDKGGSDPEAVATRYVEAMLDGDCGAMVDSVVLAGRTREDALSECEGYLDEAGFGGTEIPEEIAAELPTELVSASLASETESAATVTIEFRTQGGDTLSEDIDLVKEDGDWKVDIGLLADAGDLPDDLPDMPDDGGDSGSGDSDSGSGGGSSTSPPLDDPEALDDPALADLASSCGDGDMVACDDLYWDSALGGELEAYAKTCGGLAPAGDAGGSCEELYG